MPTLLTTETRELYRIDYVFSDGQRLHDDGLWSKEEAEREMTRLQKPSRRGRYEMVNAGPVAVQVLA